jgi:hypothetical protein
MIVFFILALATAARGDSSRGIRLILLTSVSQPRAQATLRTLTRLLAHLSPTTLASIGADFSIDHCGLPGHVLAVTASAQITVEAFGDDYPQRAET